MQLRKVEFYRLDSKNREPLLDADTCQLQKAIQYNANVNIKLANYLEILEHLATLQENNLLKRGYKDIFMIIISRTHLK